MKKIYIDCGIKNDDTAGQNLFWPILSVFPESFSWHQPENKKYSLVFTSKNTVKIFTKKYSFQECIGSNLEHICAVGSNTAKLIGTEMENKYQVIFPKEEGLLNLLTETHFSGGSLVYIFTALNGKTQETLELLNERKINFSCHMVPIYRLEPAKENFLQTLFPSKLVGAEYKFIFCCRSGQVLRTLVDQLLYFFSCSSPRNLPNNIYFSVSKASAQNEIQALDLIDRIAS